jgi:hypothetical protein
LLGGCKGYAVEEEKVYRPHFSFVIAESLEQKALDSIKQKKELSNDLSKTKKIIYKRSYQRIQKISC